MTVCIDPALSDLRFALSSDSSNHPTTSAAVAIGEVMPLVLARYGIGWRNGEMEFANESDASDLLIGPSIVAIG